MCRHFPWVQLLRAVKLQAEQAEGGTGGPGRDVGVDVHGGGDLGVAQDLHRDPWVGVEFNEQRRAGMAGAVDRDAGHAGLGAAALKRPIQVPRIHRSAGASGNQKTAVRGTALARLVATLCDLR